MDSLDASPVEKYSVLSYASHHFIFVLGQSCASRMSSLPPNLPSEPSDRSCSLPKPDQTEPPARRARTRAPKCLVVHRAPRPAVTSIPGIRSSFCFRVAADNVLAFRELSCRCSRSLDLSHQWRACQNEAAGTWMRITMACTAASSPARTRTQRSTISAARR